MKKEYNITEEDYVLADKLYSKPTKNILIFYFVSALALILASITYDKIIIGICGIIGGYIGQATVRHLYSPWATKRQYRSYKAAHKPILISKTPEGINFKSEVGDAILIWEHIHSWRENTNYLLIYQAPKIYHIIPKRIGSIANDIRESLINKVGSAK